MQIAKILSKRVVLLLLILINIKSAWDFLAVQWLRLQVSNAGGSGLIPGWGTKSPPTCHMAKKNVKPPPKEYPS